MKKFILIGHPVGHSVSPAIHSVAYQELGLDAEYSTVDCPEPQAVKRMVDELRQGTIQGANVTVPWKELAFELADEKDPTAQRVGVANVLGRTAHGSIIAYNTDASALAEELASSVQAAQVEVKGRPAALVLGNGGAARAAVVACQMAGIVRVGVSARRFKSELGPEHWDNAAALRDLGAELLAWPDTKNEAVAEYLKNTHLLVQATSAGMKGTQGGGDICAALPWERFQAGVAYDLVYNPPVTPFLSRAAELGHTAVGGLGMLVGQARDAIEIWMGQKPEREPMMRAARRALGL